jgi:LAGLIDADG endonuclease
MEVSDRDGFWLAGLTDGEGCFSLHTSRRRNKRHPERRFRNVSFSFKIALRSDDVSTLIEIHRILGVGHVSKWEMKRGTVHVAANGKPYRGHPLKAFVVHSRADIASVISFFRRFPLRSKKAKDFDVWAKAFERFNSAIAETPLEWVSLNVSSRISKVERRPLKGTPRRRFRMIPDTLYEELSRYACEIRNARQFR